MKAPSTSWYNDMMTQWSFDCYDEWCWYVDILFILWWHTAFLWILFKMFYDEWCWYVDSLYFVMTHGVPLNSIKLMMTILLRCFVCGALHLCWERGAYLDSKCMEIDW